MKYIKYIGYAMLGISVLVLILAFFSKGDSGIDLMLYWTYVLLGLTILAALLFPLINIVTNPKGAIRSLIGLVIIAAVLVVSYAVSSDTPIITPVATFDNPFTLKFTDMGLYTTYIALGAALLAVLFGEIRAMFK